MSTAMIIDPGAPAIAMRRWRVVSLGVPLLFGLSSGASLGTQHLEVLNTWQAWAIELLVSTGVGALLGYLLLALLKAPTNPPAILAQVRLLVACLAISGLAIAVGYGAPIAYWRIDHTPQSQSLQWYTARVSYLTEWSQRLLTPTESSSSASEPGPAAPESAQVGAERARVALVLAFVLADWLAIGSLLYLLSSSVLSLLGSTDLERNRSKQRNALTSILLLTLAVDAGWIWLHPPTLESGETTAWWPIVVNLVHGRGYAACSDDYFPFCGPGNEVTASREPLPVFLFTAVAMLTGESIFAATVVEVVLDLAIGLGVFFLGRRLTDARIGLVGALLWAMYVPALAYLPQVSGELTAGLCATWGVLFFVWARKTDRIRDWLLAGVGIALGALSRSVLLVIAPVLAIGLIFWRHPPVPQFRPSPLARNLRASLLFTVAVGVTLSPWVWRNYSTLGRPVVGSTLFGYNLYRYNRIVTTEDYLRFVGWREATDEVEALVERRPDLTGTENEAQMDAVYREEAMRRIRAQPLRYASLSLYRFLMLWFDWGVERGYGGSEAGYQYAIAVVQGALLVTAVVGLFEVWPESWPLALSVLAVCAAYLPVCGRFRFVVPMMPLVMTLSAVGCERVRASCSARGSSKASRGSR